MAVSRSVTFIDPFAEGHHLYYASLLASGLVAHGYSVSAVGSAAFIEGIGKTVALNAAEAVDCPGVFDITELEKRAFLKKAFKAARSFKTDAVHLLQLDNFILPLISTGPFTRLDGVYATLHWASILEPFSHGALSRSKNHLQRLALRRLVKNGLRLMAHSKSFAAALNGMTSSNAAGYVPYPVDFPVSQPSGIKEAGRRLRASLGIPSDSIVMLAFGGTRQEKGADLAVTALKELPENVFLVIAGKEEQFTKNDISTLAERLGVSGRLRLCLEYIPEEKVTEFFSASDIVIAPYRKTFAGQCGPVTIAASLGIPVVGTDSMLIKEMIDTYSLGSTFPAGDPVAFSSSVIKTVSHSNFNPNRDRFIKDHGKKAFCDLVIKCYDQQ